MCASSVIGSLPGAGVPGAGVRGRVLTIPPRIERDVVDQAGRADADGGGEGRRVERGDRDVVDAESGASRIARAVSGSPVASARGRASARARSSGESRTLRDERASPSSSRTVGITHELELELEVGDHPAQDVDLLRVLLAVEREVGPDDVEQLEADRRDAAEVARAVLAFEDRAELGHVDPRLVPGRVHLGGGRREDDVDAGRARDLEVARLVARVAVQVGRLAELRRVDEEAHDDGVARRARRVEQRPVALVERAHRRDETDPPRRAGRRAPRGRRRSCGRRSRRCSVRAASWAVSAARASYAGSSSGAASAIAARCRSTVSQSPRSIGPVSCEVVVDHSAHERVERLGRRFCRREQIAGGSAQRDEVVRRDRGARVVERTALVVEHERPQAERPRRGSSPAATASSVSPVTAAQAPSSCSAPRSW